jgi:hypothetical protein
MVRGLTRSSAGWFSLGLGFVLAFACARAPAAEEKAVIVLKDGREIAGVVVREDANAVFLKAENGEERGIARARIEKIIRAGEQRADPSQPAAVAATKPPATPPNAAPPPISDAKQHELAENRELFEELKALGDPSREKRQGALARAKDLGFRAVPILTGSLHPKAKMPVELRLGCLRALAELGPLDLVSADGIAWIAMKDADPEVRREACRTIRRLKDDRAVEYILRYAVSEDRPSQIVAALALRELNDDRAFATLAAAIPRPTISGAMPHDPLAPEQVDLPTGPYGAKLPVYLAKQDVAGSATNIATPPAEALKLIAGKDLGSLPFAWIAWLREKAGLLSAKDREEEARTRGLRDRMGNPPNEVRGP